MTLSNDLKYFHMQNTQGRRVCLLNGAYLLTQSEVTAYVDKVKRSGSIHHKSAIKHYFSDICSFLDEMIKGIMYHNFLFLEKNAILLICSLFENFRAVN